MGKCVLILQAKRQEKNEKEGKWSPHDGEVRRSVGSGGVKFVNLVPNHLLGGLFSL